MNATKKFFLIPQPGVEQPEVIEADYKMKDCMLSLDMRAPLVGYALRGWAVDCTPKHGLDPENTICDSAILKLFTVWRVLFLRQGTQGISNQVEN